MKQRADVDRQEAWRKSMKDDEKVVLWVFAVGLVAVLLLTGYVVCRALRAVYF